jgi:hypothetical protein
MNFLRFKPTRTKNAERFQKIGIQNLSEELLIRIIAALALVTASVALEPNVLGANTFVGSISLCLGSVLNPGYLHRISSIHRDYRITIEMVNKEFKFSLTALIFMSPLVLLFQSEISHLMIMANVFSYLLMYAAFSYRDIQVARIREKNIPFATSASTYISGGFLGILSCLAIFVYRQPAFIPLSTVLVILPMLIKLSAIVRNTLQPELEHKNQTTKYYSRVSAKFAIMGILGGLLMVVDNFIIFGMLTLSELGYYGVAFAIVTFIVNIIGTTLQRNEFMKNIGHIPRTSSVLLFTAFFLGIIISVCLFLSASYFDLQVIGRASLLSMILSVGIPFRIRNLHLTVLIEKFGSFSTRLTSQLVSIAALLISGIVAIPHYGLVGMCIASNSTFAFLCLFNKYLARRIRLDVGNGG